MVSAIAGTFIIISYNWLRSAATPIFTSYYSRDLIPVASVIMIFALFGFIYIYNKILTAFGPRVTFFITSLGSILTLSLFYLLLKLEIKEAAFILYVFRPIYVVVLIEQVWSYFNTKNTTASAKLLTGPMMGIVSIGPTLSGQYLKYYASEIGSVNVVLISALFLIPTMIVMFFALKGLSLKEEKSEDKQVESSMGFSALKENKVLLALFFIVITSQVFSALASFRFESTVTGSGMSMNEQTSYYAGFYSYINLFTSILQFIGVPILLSRIPVGYIHLGVPIFHCLLGIIVLFNPTLNLIMLSTFTFKVFDYSLFKGAKELIYVPLSKEVKYRTKQFIDVLGYRFGTGGIALLFSFITFSGAKVPESLYSIVATLTTFAWIFFAVVIFRHLKNQETHS